MLKVVSFKLRPFITAHITTPILNGNEMGPREQVQKFWIPENYLSLAEFLNLCETTAR
jgi:hypothetical protein